MFPQIVEMPRQMKRAGYEKKCMFHERPLFQYLYRKIEGWGVKCFLDNERIDSFALYAVTDFTHLFLRDLEINGGSCGLKMIVDKKAEQFPDGFRGYAVVLPDQLIAQYKEQSVRKIIVMSVLHENEIIDELLEKGVLLNDIISFISVLYSEV